MITFYFSIHIYNKRVPSRACVVNPLLLFYVPKVHVIWKNLMPIRRAHHLLYLETNSSWQGHPSYSSLGTNGKHPKILNPKILNFTILGF